MHVWYSHVILLCVCVRIARGAVWRPNPPSRVESASQPPADPPVCHTANRIVRPLEQHEVRARPLEQQRERGSCAADGAVGATGLQGHGQRQQVLWQRRRPRIHRLGIGIHKSPLSLRTLTLVPPFIPLARNFIPCPPRRPLRLIRLDQLRPSSAAAAPSTCPLPQPEPPTRLSHSASQTADPTAPRLSPPLSAFHHGSHQAGRTTTVQKNRTRTRAAASRCPKVGAKRSQRRQGSGSSQRN